MRRWRKRQTSGVVGKPALTSRRTNTQSLVENVWGIKHILSSPNTQLIKTMGLGQQQHER
jgi:hypothetical protein